MSKQDNKFVNLSEEYELKGWLERRGFSQSRENVNKLNEFDLGKLITNPPAKLRDYLAAFFDALLADAAGQPLSIKLEGRYSYQLSLEVESMVRTQLPMYLLTPVDFVPEGTTPVFVDTIVDATTNWMRKHQPNLSRSSQLNFQFDIFAGQTADMAQRILLLSVSNLHVDANIVEFFE